MTISEIELFGHLTVSKQMNCFGTLQFLEPFKSMQTKE